MTLYTREDILKKPLDSDCKTANCCTNEYDEDDNRVLCYGLKDSGVVIEKCTKCPAFLLNAVPVSQ